jgi:hypothetical protein
VLLLSYGAKTTVYDTGLGRHMDSVLR